MPNWCYNSLLIEGAPAQIAEVKQMLNKPFKKHHDSWNAETGKMEITETSYQTPVFAFHNIYNHIEDGVPDEVYIKQSDHQLGEPITFQGNNWYDWNVRNWGTKWDVGNHDGDKYPDTELITDTVDTISYRFNTAWSPPTEAITKLSEKYPECEITLSYEEETGWGGEILFANGQATEIESYQTKCRDCDSIDTLEYCEICAIDVCSECKDMNEANPEDVADCEEHRESISTD